MASVTVDVSSLSQYEAAEYRRELITAICNPGSEFDMNGPDYETDLAAYRAQVTQVDAYLATFPQKI